MTKKNQRPVYLNLFKIRLPVGGVVSIAHRVTGVLLVLALPLGLYFLEISLRDEARFNEIRAWLGSTPGRVGIGIVAWLFAQHFFSGLRHLLLDVDVGVHKAQARASAWLCFALSVVTVIVVEVAWIA